MIKDLLLAYLTGMLKGDTLEMIWAIFNVLISGTSFLDVFILPGIWDLYHIHHCICKHIILTN